MERFSYQEAVDYIEELPKFTKKHTLEHTRQFLAFLGNPCRNKKIIHVAGTNGKGSVCAYLQAMLLAAERRTGLFTSPHLIKVNERMNIQGQMVSDEFFEEVFWLVKKAVAAMAKQEISHPSYFEFLFGMAMTAFEIADVEYVILETGLGGRLDATNAFAVPYLTIITSLGLDHEAILGDTIEEIAYEKAGIIKKGVPVICAQNEAAALAVIRNRAGELGSECREISNCAHEIREIGRKDIAFSIANAYYEDVMWRLSGTGTYEPGNAVLALEAMRYIAAEEGWNKNLPLWQDALGKVCWQGRMEEIRPGIIVDGAHNIQAMKAVADSISRQQSGKVIILFAAVQDKSYEEMIEYLCRQVDAELFITVNLNDERSADAGELAALFRKYTNSKVAVKESVKQALKYIEDKRGKDQQVYCLGSLYLVGEMKASFEGGVINA